MNIHRQQLVVLVSWYIFNNGLDNEGCGRSLDVACYSFSYLLNQIKNSEAPPEGTEAVIVTDKSLTIDQRTVVSTALRFTKHPSHASIQTFEITQLL